MRTDGRRQGRPLHVVRSVRTGRNMGVASHDAGRGHSTLHLAADDSPEEARRALRPRRDRRCRRRDAREPCLALAAGGGARPHRRRARATPCRDHRTGEHPVGPEGTPRLVRRRAQGGEALLQAIPAVPVPGTRLVAIDHRGLGRVDGHRHGAIGGSETRGTLGPPRAGRGPRAVRQDSELRRPHRESGRRGLPADRGTGGHAQRPARADSGKARPRLPGI